MPSAERNLFSRNPEVCTCREEDYQILDVEYAAHTETQNLTKAELTLLSDNNVVWYKGIILKSPTKVLSRQCFHQYYFARHRPILTVRIHRHTHSRTFVIGNIFSPNIFIPSLKVLLWYTHVNSRTKIWSSNKFGARQNNFTSSVEILLLNRKQMKYFL